MARFMAALALPYMFDGSIAIGREGGVPPLIALTRSEAELLFTCVHLPSKKWLGSWLH
ncbi:hypothetical protein F2Q70_00008839 [Brassica cretica]|uniref:Uncharacterized protein n=1 Tax=Brassica cretica TaxID=69181 RepID=A0A8S9M8J1_BRACR|nr:hypothetical protein F2Q70_00008839 [Brassica cretica]